MGQAILWAAIAVAFLVSIYLNGRKKDGFVKFFSRGAFMRDLNNKTTLDLKDKPKTRIEA